MSDPSTTSYVFEPEVIAEFAKDFDEFAPEVIAEFENDFDEFEPEVIAEFENDFQVGGNIEQHVNIGLEFRQRVNKFNTEGSAFNVQFQDLENVANLNAFLNEVSFLLIYSNNTEVIQQLFYCFFNNTGGYSAICL